MSVILLKSKGAAGGSSSTWVTEVPSGAVNGTNDTYVLTYTPVAGSLFFYFGNSNSLTPLGEDVHYTLTDKTVVVDTVRPTGTVFAQYQTLDTVVADYEDFLFQDDEPFLFQDDTQYEFNTPA